MHQARKGGAMELVALVREVCMTFGVPEEVSSDGGPQFVSAEFAGFCKDWGIKQRVSSAYFPHSNTRAELGVKSMKRLLRDNLGRDGTLDNTRVARAIMEYRNTPDRDTGRSPAQVVYGRQLRDFLPVARGKYIPRKEWLLSREQREVALARRHCAKGEELTRGTKELVPLVPGTIVLVQNQVGPNAKKWDKSGVILADKGNSQYQVKLDGSGRVTLRNRAFLKRIVPFMMKKQEGRALELERQGGARVEVRSPEVEVPEVEVPDVEVEVPVRVPVEGIGEAQAPRRSRRAVVRPASYKV